MLTLANASSVKAAFQHVVKYEQVCGLQINLKKNERSSLQTIYSFAERSAANSMDKPFFTTFRHRDRFTLRH